MRYVMTPAPARRIQQRPILSAGNTDGITRVSVVEDDPVMRNLLSETIEACDDLVLVSVADNAVSASALIDAGGYDVLLCDLGLPDGSGIDLIKREAQLARDTDILVITVFANQRKVLDAVRAGARGYLLKDEHMEDCMEAIRDIRRGGSPISPIIARQLLKQIAPDTAGAATSEEPPLETPLSAREYEVLTLLARGYSNAECAELLSISSNTVGTHIKKIYRKLNVSNRMEAVYEASSKGLLTQ